MFNGTIPSSRSIPTRSSSSALRRNQDGREPKVHTARYKATTLWNNIVRQFRQEMPLKRHRRQLTYFEDSFTGKEAVDFLMVLLPKLIFEGRQVERSNCSTLLQKFVDQGLIKRARSNSNEKDIFRDDASLYIFVDDCAPCEMNRTPRVLRTSSCHEELRCRSRTPTRTNASYVNDYSAFTYRRITSPTPSRMFHRRLSSSHGNLLSLLPSYTKEETAQGPNAGYHVNPERNKPTLLVMDKRKEVGRYFNSQVKQVHTPSKTTHKCVTEVDMWCIWKECLLSRLHRILCVENNPIVTWNVNGQDVKWNCQRVGSSGIVKQRSDREEFPRYIMRLMRYLEQFPFPSGTSNVIIYKDNQEVNVFKTVCSRLSCENSILTNAEASAIFEVISLSRDIGLTDSPILRSSFHIETEFSEDAPHSRVVPRSPSSMLPHRIRKTSSNLFCTLCAEHPRLSRCTANRSKLKQNRKLLAILQEDNVNDSSLKADASESLLSVQERAKNHLRGIAENTDVFQLPGLRQSLGLMQRSGEMRSIICDEAADSVQLPGFMKLSIEEPQYSASSSSNLFSYRTAKVSSFLGGLDEVTLEALSLILLTLPPPRRRRLHHLVRFMNKIAANHCIQLDQQHSNRYMVLRELSGCVVSMGPEPPALSPSECTQLVTVLLDYEHQIFAVPTSLEFEVDAILRQQQGDKVIMNQRHLEKFSSKVEGNAQCCNIAQNDHNDEEKRRLAENLLELLDQICKDESMSIREKQRRLKKFKKTYPSVYAQKFPSTELKKARRNSEQKFLSKLFER